jgi:signal transduction histidine kinase
VGRDILKQTLHQQVRQLEHDFNALNRSSNTWNDLQLRSLDTLAFNIRRLSSSVEDLPNTPLTNNTRHELRNQLTVILGFAQVMLHRRAGEMTLEATVHLQKMVIMVNRINDFLDYDQQQPLHA